MASSHASSAFAHTRVWVFVHVPGSWSAASVCLASPSFRLPSPTSLHPLIRGSSNLLSGGEERKGRGLLIQRPQTTLHKPILIITEAKSQLKQTTTDKAGSATPHPPNMPPTAKTGRKTRTYLYTKATKANQVYFDRDQTNALCQLRLKLVQPGQWIIVGHG